MHIRDLSRCARATLLLCATWLGCGERELAPSFQRHGLEQPYVEGELLVRFRTSSQVHAADTEQLHASLGARVVRRFRHQPGVELLRLPEGLSVSEALEAYRAHPDVEVAEPNLRFHATRTPDDVRFGEQWGLHNRRQAGGKADADINAPEAWDLTTGSDSVVVGLIDSGLDTTHIDIMENLWVNSGEISGNGLDDDNNGYVDDLNGIDALTHSGKVVDESGHGTHVAGILAARGGNNVGMAGVSWRAKIVTCRFLDANDIGTTEGALECLDYLYALKTRAQDPVNVVVTNNSWGGPTRSELLEQAIARHRDVGILFVTAAGNSGSDMDAEAARLYPAASSLTNVLTVAATDSGDALASFSNRGRRTVHIAAPGASILGPAPQGRYAMRSGTSMAAAHVTGVVALLKAQESSRDWRTLRNLVLAGGQEVSALAPHTVTGRRLRAAGVSGTGSLTCADQLVQAFHQPVSAVVGASEQAPARIALLNIRCGVPAGPLTLTAYPSGEQLTLQDDGVGFDQVAGDGIYSAEWFPSTPGGHLLRLPSGDSLLVQRDRENGSAPTVGPLQTIPSFDEGAPATFAASFDDPQFPQEPGSVLWDFHYGGTAFHPEVFQSPAWPARFEQSLMYPDSGAYAVAVHALGKDGMPSALAVFPVEIRNVAPTVGTLNASTLQLQEGQSVVFTSSFSDPGVRDAPWTSAWDVDSDGLSFSPDVSQQHTARGAISLTHAFTNQGSFQVRLQVTDKDGGASALREVAVQVTDLSPSILAFEASPSQVDEGRPVQLHVQAQGAPADPLTRYQWDFDGDGTFDLVTPEPRVHHAYANDPAETYTVKVRAEDEDNYVEQTLTVQVRNVAPRVEPMASVVELAEDAALSFPLPVQDVDPLSFKLTQAPEGMTVSADGRVEWKPTEEQRGMHPGTDHPVSLMVDDGDGGQAEVRFTVHAQSWKGAERPTPPPPPVTPPPPPVNPPPPPVTPPPAPPPAPIEEPGPSDTEGSGCSATGTASLELMGLLLAVSALRRRRSSSAR
jgi:subtilisin family serine protease/PKD repeat protein